MTKTYIPEAALQQHIAVLGKNGSGKTYTSKAVIVEPLLEDGRHVAIVDPTSAWWGLRNSADGKGPGYKIIVLGGDHGDLPLPALGGAAVARLIVEQGLNVIADTGNLTVGERTRWMVDFAGTIYRLNRVPLYLVLDEAHVFAPQGKVPDPDTGKMLHAVNQLASGGRSRGIRLTMITQRPQKLHKDALTTADTLIAMRVLAPHDREAVKAWIDGCGDPAQGKEVLNSLSGLKRGEGWCWYPEGAFLQRAKFPAIRTFDSSATPTDGHAIASPKGAAEVDLTEIREALAEAVKEAAENDPKLLRARVKELERDNAHLRQSHGAALTYASNQLSEDIIDAQARGRREGFVAALHKVREVAEGMKGWADLIQRPIRDFNADLDKFIVDAEAELAKVAISETSLQRPKAAPLGVTPGAVRTIRSASEAPARRPATIPLAAAAGPGEALSKAERLILTALAQYQEGRTKVQVAVLAGYAVEGGGFKNALGALRSAGRIDGPPEQLVITEAGLAALGAFEPLPHGKELLEHWYRQLGKAEKKSLEALVEVYPRTLSKAQLAALAGYDEGGGGFKNALGRLRTLELIKGRAEIKASEDLFDE